MTRYVANIALKGHLSLTSYSAADNAWLGTQNKSTGSLLFPWPLDTSLWKRMLSLGIMSQSIPPTFSSQRISLE
jgi:hypothetical protein